MLLYYSLSMFVFWKDSMAKGDTGISEYCIHLRFSQLLPIIFKPSFH